MNETYDEAMNRIQGQVEQHSQLAMSALTWISNAIRPLQPKELREALAVEPGDHALDDEAIPEEALILSVSAGLITIDAESETIRLVHFTVEEYFRDLKHKWFPRAHSQIAETCLTYLSFNVFKSGDCSSDEKYKAQLEKNCLLDYAARNWGLHASQAENDIGDVALTFLLDKDKKGRTPLYHAIKYGREGVVELLLDRNDVAADYRDMQGHTLLDYAIKRGHNGIVKLLKKKLGDEDKMNM